MDVCLRQQITVFMEKEASEAFEAHQYSISSGLGATWRKKCLMVEEEEEGKQVPELQPEQQRISEGEEASTSPSKTEMGLHLFGTRINTDGVL